MTVAELIQTLKKFPLDHAVTIGVDGQEVGGAIAVDDGTVLLLLRAE